MSNQERIIKHIKTISRLCSIIINFLPVIFVSCLRYIFYYLPIVSQKTMDSLLQDMIVIAIENSGSLFVCILFPFFTIRILNFYLDKRSPVSVASTRPHFSWNDKENTTFERHNPYALFPGHFGNTCEKWPFRKNRKYRRKSICQWDYRTSLQSKIKRNRRRCDNKSQASERHEEITSR